MNNKIFNEIMELEPSTLITLYEIILKDKNDKLNDEMYEDKA